MNIIDRRFLDFQLTVNGIFNNPPTTGNNFIVGSEPTGEFEGAKPNYIALYTPNGWKFTQPVLNQELFNLITGEILIYDGSNWRVDEYFKGKCVNIVDMAMFGYDTAPEPVDVSADNYYFNTVTKEIFRWNFSKWEKFDISNPMSFNILVYVNSWYRYYFDGTTFVEASINNGLYLLLYGMIQDGNSIQTVIDNSYKLENTSLYLFYWKYFKRIYPLDTSDITLSGGKEFYTETHTLTAEEVSSKSFTLTYSVESGEETNILCSVSGVIQPANIAFAVSGNTLSWNDKTLDGLLASNDVFVVHYVKAAE